MHSLRLAVATRCFALPIKDSLRAAAETGATGVQFDARNELKPQELSGTGRRQLLHAMGELGLKVASLQFPTRRSYYDQDQLDARLHATRNVMEFASQLGCQTVTLRIGHVPEVEDSSAFSMLCEILDDLARYGNHLGVGLAITPMHDSPDALRRLSDSVQQGLIGVNFDPAVFVMSGYAPGQAFRTLYDRILHVQVRDAIRHLEGEGQEVAVGRGEVEWDELLALLDEAGYRGWSTVDRTGGDDKPGDCARAVQYLKRVALE